MTNHSHRSLWWWIAAGSLLIIAAGWVLVGAGRPMIAGTERSEFAALLAAWKHATGGHFARGVVPAPLMFPRDHGVHGETPAERWEVLMDAVSGDRRFSLQFTLSRLGAAPVDTSHPSRWRASQFFHSVVAIDVAGERHSRGYERYARTALGLAGFDREPPRISVLGNAIGWRDPGVETDDCSLTVAEPGFEAQLRLLALKPMQMDAGMIAAQGRWAGYALPRNAVSGVLVVDGRSLPVQGTAWISHLWGDLPPVGGQIRFMRGMFMFDDGSEVSLLQTRRRDGSGEASLQAVRVEPDGRAEPLDADAISLGSGSWKRTDVNRMQLRIRGRWVDLTLVPRRVTSGDETSGRKAGVVVDIEQAGGGGASLGWGVLEFDEN